MPNLVPINHSPVTPVRRAALYRQTGRELQRLESRTLVRLADVQADGIVQGEKLHEIDNLTREAMSGQAMLARWRDTLSAGDPFVADEMRFFSDVARMGKGEIIASTIDCFNRSC
jgi:hypothetical protein